MDFMDFMFLENQAWDNFINELIETRKYCNGEIQYSHLAKLLRKHGFNYETLSDQQALEIEEIVSIA